MRFLVLIAYMLKSSFKRKCWRIQQELEVLSPTVLDNVCMRPGTALTRLRICALLSKASLLAVGISTKLMCTDLIMLKA